MRLSRVSLFVLAAKPTRPERDSQIEGKPGVFCPRPASLRGTIPQPKRSYIMIMINQNWVFGQNAGLDFSTSTTSGNQINTLEGCACISGANGNLLLYTDGQRVWDGGHFQRAMGLQGNPSSTQSAIIVPNPVNKDQYYVFTADGASGGNNHVNGILIDTSTWAPVTQLSSIMTMPPTNGFSPTEKLTAIQHANCKDFWVITIIQALQTGQLMPRRPGRRYSDFQMALPDEKTKEGRDFPVPLSHSRLTQTWPDRPWTRRIN